MTRPNRQLLRLYFITVILVGLFGFWYATTNWQVETAALQEVNVGGNGDWVDFLATLGEEAIQLFLGFTSGQ